MKKINLLVIAFFMGITFQMNAQTADEIISNYFKNTGGKEIWQKLQGVKMSAEINQGMVIPLEIFQLKGGNKMTVINFQGKLIKQDVFDGQMLWGINMMTQKAEKSDKEATENAKLNVNDFPDPFLNYKTNGYSIELLGNETIDGAETFKIKITKKPQTIDGKLEDNISYYYFDKENFVPIAVHSEIKSGPGKGQIIEIKMSDYQEVEGLFFPFSISQSLKGQSGPSIIIKKIELNPTVDAKEFAFPEETTETPSTK